MNGLLLDRHGFAALAAANDNAPPWPALGTLLVGLGASLIGWAGVMALFRLVVG